MNPEEIRADFPALDRTVNGHRLAYLDSAATAQKPRQVIDAVRELYEEHNANVHRCVHTLAEEATAIYDDAHDAVGGFVGVDGEHTVFTRNTTEALNLVAQGWAEEHLGPGDEILLTEMEHHSNILPWQRAAERTGADLRYAAVTGDGRIDMDDLRAKMTDDTALVATCHVSNVLGTVNPVREIADLAHDRGAKFVVDAAQSVPHMPVDIDAVGADALAFSGHKMLGPSGTGVLAARGELLAETEPMLRGGGMIRRVEKQEATWAEPPHKFEAGTPHIAGAAGLAAAVDYLESVGMENVDAHTSRLAELAYERLSAVEGVTVYGPPERSGLISYTMEQAHPHDLSTLLDEEGIAVRGGHHCAQPLAEVLGVDSTSRASFYIYNTEEEVDRLVDAIREAAEVFG